MDAENKWESVKRFFERIGKRNLMIAGAVVLIGVAVALNWVFFTGNDQDDGFSYDASAGMSGNYGAEMITTAVGSDTTVEDVVESPDSYFSSVEISRQRARDEALEVLNAVVENQEADEAVRSEAMKEIQAIAKEMAQESNIESLLMSKGFEKCVAVISGNNANIVVKNEGRLQTSQLAQINAVVYEQAGIEPVNITIVAKE
ncbi:MAG: SpoIIIAH-like family protein [Ruminococcaceae bacterium]|nr:SpoIIIAH-like family protein [Oscillospiraceae bacterium]